MRAIGIIINFAILLGGIYLVIIISDPENKKNVADYVQKELAERNLPFSSAIAKFMPTIVLSVINLAVPEFTKISVKIE